MREFFATLRVGLLDMRGDLRRFGLLIGTLAIGTALIAGVSSVGESIRQAVERDAALIMGGDVELVRADRAATPNELAVIGGFGAVASVIDTNLRAETEAGTAFADLIAVGETYPLLGRVGSPQLQDGISVFEQLGPGEGGAYGVLVTALMLDQLQARPGDVIAIGGTPFEVRGELFGVPDAAVRGFRLGLPVVINSAALASIGDMTSPLPGLGTFFRYKVKLDGGDAEAGRDALVTALADPSWTIRTARDGLGPMVRYYDLFMRFLVIVGLASLLVGGVSVWTGISAYIAERASVIAILRSLGASRPRILLHFLTQVLALAAAGVLIGLTIGASLALLALPAIGQAVGVPLAPQLHLVPLAVAGAIGLVTAFAFSYLPLQQAQTVSAITLFRSKGMSAPAIDWRLLRDPAVLVPLILSAGAFVLLATMMTRDALLVGAFLTISIAAVLLFRVALAIALVGVRRLPETRQRTLRYALRDIAAAGSNAPSVVVSIGLALAMLVVVLVLQVNLRNEYLGASVFDAPSFVASDLFRDEVEILEGMRDRGEIAAFTATPMLRGAVSAINGTPVTSLSPRGPEASFLLSGEIPMTYRAVMPASSRIVEGQWWAADYAGAPLVSLHQSLRGGLGIKLGDSVTISIFGEEITATVASFRDYSWQGGIDFLATFSPGVLDAYPATLLGAVTAAPGMEDIVEREIALALPDARFIAIGETLRQITVALGQLSLAASLVGGLAVGNGLLVLIGSLATGRRQRQADAAITKVLGARRWEVLGVAVLRYLIVAAFAALLATPVGMILAWVLTQMLLDVEFAFDADTLAGVIGAAIAITGILGATTILRGLRPRTALFLRELGAE